MSDSERLPQNLSKKEIQNIIDEVIDSLIEESSITQKYPVNYQPTWGDLLLDNLKKQAQKEYLRAKKEVENTAYGGFSRPGNLNPPCIQPLIPGDEIEGIGDS